MSNTTGYDLDDILAEFHAQEKQAQEPAPGKARASREDPEVGKTTVFGSVNPDPRRSEPRDPGSAGIDYDKLPRIHAEAPSALANPKETSQRIPPLSDEDAERLRRQKRRRSAAAFRRAAFTILLALTLLLGGTLLFFRSRQQEAPAPQGLTVNLNETIDDLSQDFILGP